MKRVITLFLISILVFTFLPGKTQAEENDGVFSIVWISDTQSIVYHDEELPGALESMGDWIMENKEPKNIVYAVQTGDAVDNGFVDKQQKAYGKLYYKFSSSIPYVGIAGNHDLGVKLQSWEAYLNTQPVLETKEWLKYEGGKAIYRTFKVGSEKFIIVGVGYGAEEESVGWVNRVLKIYSDHTAILLFHQYLRSEGTYINVGAKMFEAVVKPNPNVRLVLCGHVRGENAYRAEEIDDDGDGKPDRTVNALMYNYQNWSKNCGQLRLLTFDTKDRSVTVYTYSPYTKKEYKDKTFGAATFILNDAF